jgi:hypothetical protein
MMHRRRRQFQKFAQKLTLWMKGSQIVSFSKKKSNNFETILRIHFARLPSIGHKTTARQRKEEKKGRRMPVGKYQTVNNAPPKSLTCIYSFIYI